VAAFGAFFFTVGFAATADFEALALEACSSNFRAHSAVAMK
jgi:hypothetical protein